MLNPKKYFPKINNTIINILAVVINVSGVQVKPKHKLSKRIHGSVMSNT